jgi:hypothetical protein
MGEGDEVVRVARRWLEEPKSKFDFRSHIKTSTTAINLEDSEAARKSDPYCSFSVTPVILIRGGSRRRELKLYV